MVPARHRRSTTIYWLVGLVALAAVALATTYAVGGRAAPPDKPDVRVLFVGDSLTQGYYATSARSTFRELMAARWSRDATVTTDVAAIAGATTAKVTRSLDPHLREHPDVVVIELGTNDQREAETVAEFTHDWTALTAKITAFDPGAQLICAGVWGSGVREGAFDAVVRGACHAAGGAFRSLAAAYDVATDHGPVGRSTWLGPADRFHPNDLGHRAIAAALLSGMPVAPPAFKFP